MTKGKWMATVCLLGLLGSLGCSSGSSGNSKLRDIEDDVEAVLQIQAFVVDALNPFAANPAPAAGTDRVGAAEPCSLVDQPLCPGAVEECPTDGSDIDIVITDCSRSDPDMGTLVVSGRLTYSPDETWPAGSNDAFVTSSSEGNWRYVTTFANSVEVMIAVTDLVEGTTADCVGNLTTLVADCELVELAPI